MSYFKMEWVTNYIQNPNDLIIFDVGAFDFSDSVNFKNHFPNSSVYAFEAYTFNYEKYKHIGEPSGIKMYNIAISYKTSETLFFNSTNFNGVEWTGSGSILKPSDKEGVEIHTGLNYNRDGLKVKTIRIDDFCKENNIQKIDVLHMDIQGAEYYGIIGLGDKLKPKIIFCETCEYDSYENSLTQKDLDELLIKLGYEIKERLQYDTLYILKND